jgi:hypothetical protein
MNIDEKHDPASVLAHWTYTREEWRRFILWKKLKKSFFHYTIYFFTPKNEQQIPEVKITRERVWVGSDHQHFHSDEHQLKRIDVRDEGKLNIIEITYEWVKRKTPGLDAIYIPVPRGKLREAIVTQEQLMEMLE